MLRAENARAEVADNFLPGCGKAEPLAVARPSVEKNLLRVMWVYTIGMRKVVPTLTRCALRIPFTCKIR